MIETGVESTESNAAPPVALWLGAAGALPFVAAAAAVLLADPWRGPALLALMTYGAVILSFLGGIRWGLAIAGGQRGRALDLFVSVCPSLVAWGALLLPAGMGIPVLAAAFVVMLGLDRAAARRGAAPAWYPRLRTPLTAVVVAALLTAALT